MNQIPVLKYLTIAFLFESVTSIQDVHLNDLNLNTITSLIKILSKYENDVKYVIIQPSKVKQKDGEGNGKGKMYHSKLYNGIINSKLEDNKKFMKPGKHSKLIKRIIPHGLPPAKLEFDKKYNTYYRPLVRVHKRKVLPKIETILDIDGHTNGMDKYGIDVYDYYDNDEDVVKFATNNGATDDLEHLQLKETGENFGGDEELLQPFTSNRFAETYESRDELSTQLVLLKEIQKLLKEIRSRSSRIKIYHDITRVLDEIASLRSQQSGEDNDPLAPGKSVILENDDDNSPPKPKRWVSRYPPWNFWTYKKTIYQDECPEAQVKIANVCVWVPPH